MAINIVSPETNGKGIRIMVLGVGGGGNNAISRITENRLTKAETVAINTDAQALAICSADYKLQIGEKLTDGDGTGMNPETGRLAMEESAQELRELLSGVQLVFIATGMGGGTGTGASPVVAKITRELGILTIAVVTKPFELEGVLRKQQAEAGIEKLLQYTDALVVIPNDRVFNLPKEIIGVDLTADEVTIEDAYVAVDNVLERSVKSISDINSKLQYLNTDFNDLKAVVKDAGYANIAIGRKRGKNKADEVVNEILNSPLIETKLDGAKTALVCIESDSSFSMGDLDKCAKKILSHMHPDAAPIYSWVHNENFKDEVEIVVIAAKLEDIMQMPEVPTESSDDFSTSNWEML